MNLMELVGNEGVGVGSGLGEGELDGGFGGGGDGRWWRQGQQLLQDRTESSHRSGVEALVPNVTILEPTPDNWKVCRRIARGGGDRRRRLKQEEGRKETGFS